MATTTAQAFTEFKGLLELTDGQRLIVQVRRDNVAKYLRDAFPSTNATPLDASHLIGSAARGTIIRPLDDIDLMAAFNNKDSVFEKYRYDSQSFLYRVRDALKAHSTVQLVGARGQAVRFFYASAPHVDVAPMFAYNGGGYGLPNGQGRWLTTDPLAHGDYFARRHVELGYRLKPMCRMLKRWNNVHSKHLKSFHLEVMVASVFSSLNNDSRDACEKFFQWSQNYLDVSDPAGHGGVLSGYLTWAQRQAVLRNLETSRQRAAIANAAERVGNHAEAVRQWRMVFGEEFPAYG